MNEKQAKEQNDRMRAWFRERTGIDSVLLADHMAQIDKMLYIHKAEKEYSRPETRLLTHVNPRTGI